MAAQETVNPRLVKSNIDLLTRVVKKPNMVTEKSLSRPPFKFLHDLIVLIIKSTGYLRGLYSDEEFSYEQVNNKESKIVFLDKLIDAVGFINGKAIDVKATKIVAGTEVEKTNKLLNELAKAVLDKKPFLDAVAEVRKGQKPPAGAPAAATASSSGAPVKGTAAAKKTTAAKPAANVKAPAPAARGKTQAGPAAKAAAPGKAAASKATPAAKTGAKKEPEKPKKAPSPEPESSEPSMLSVEPLESDKSLESPAAKSLEPSAPPFSSGESSLIPENSADKLLEKTKPEPSQEPETPKALSKQNSVELPQPPSEPPAVDQVVNLDNNLDQLVAGLGLDDEEDDEEDGPPTEERAPPEDTLVQQEDSGIESKSNSFSHSTKSESPQPIITEVPSKVDTEYQQQPAVAALENGEEDESQEEPAPIEPPPSIKTRRTPTSEAENRKRSATIKTRRASKSGIPAQSLATLNGSISRAQNVPSSAAPATFGSEASQRRSPLVAQQMPDLPPSYEELNDAPIPARQSRMGTAQRSARPSSSRPAPPRVKTASRSRLTQLTENRMAEQVAAVDASPSTGAPAQVWPPPEGLKLNLEQDGEDGDEYVMSSQKLQDSLMKMDSSNGREESAELAQLGPNKGLLVQQLMDTKSELEGNVGAKAPATAVAPDTTTSTDTNQLRRHVQDLCQSVGTLSKALNYLHEDVDPMVGELAKWRDEYRANERQIEKLRSETTKELEPLRKELEMVELEVKEYQERLVNAKAHVHRNAILIAKLIESV